MDARAPGAAPGEREPRVVDARAHQPIGTSAYALERLPARLVECARHRHRVVSGTIWPVLPARRCLAALGGLGLDETQRTLFLLEDARQVPSIPTQAARGDQEGRHPS